MAEDRDSLTFRKTGGTTTKDLYADFGIKTTGVPMFAPEDMKEYTSRDWADEHGEDVYFPSTAYFEAYDVEVGVIYTGEAGTFRSKLNALFSYFTSGGTELDIYSPYSGTGCKSAYFKGFSNFDFESDGEMDIAEFNLNFRVTKPTSSY